jgi:hypothetical protein
LTFFVTQTFHKISWNDYNFKLAANNQVFFTTLSQVMRGVQSSEIYYLKPKSTDLTSEETLLVEYEVAMPHTLEAGYPNGDIAYEQLTIQLSNSIFKGKFDAKLSANAALYESNGNNLVLFQPTSNNVTFSQANTIIYANDDALHHVDPTGRLSGQELQIILWTCLFGFACLGAIVYYFRDRLFGERVSSSRIPSTTLQNARLLGKYANLPTTSAKAMLKYNNDNNSNNVYNTTDAGGLMSPGLVMSPGQDMSPGQVMTPGQGEMMFSPDFRPGGRGGIQMNTFIDDLEKGNASPANGSNINDNTIAISLPDKAKSFPARTTSTAMTKTYIPVYL